MTGINASPTTKVFSIPELADSIFVYLSPSHIRTLRLVSRAFLDYCSSHFSIYLTLNDYDLTQHSYQKLVHLAQKNTLSHLVQSVHLLCPLGLFEPTAANSLSATSSSSSSQQPTLSCLGPLLDQCLHIRYIFIQEITYSWSRYRMSWETSWTTPLPSAPRLPSRLTWTPDNNTESRETEDSSSGGYLRWLWDRIFVVRPKKIECQRRTWMELLPLEGPLLSRLEILVVDTGTWGYLEVNTFLDRISQSCVAKSLVKLIILDFTNISLRGLENSPGKVKWDSLRNCILALRALKLFSYKNFEIEIEGLASESNVEAIVAKMTSPAVISTYPTSTALVSNVKSLKLTSLPASLDVSQALWMLFPNVEALSISSAYSFWSGELDSIVFPCARTQNLRPILQSTTTESVVHVPSSIEPCLLPFPRLKTLDLERLSHRDWVHCRLLRYWVLDRKVQLIGRLELNYGTGGFDREASAGPALSRDQVELQRVSLGTLATEKDSYLLGLSCCRSLNDLEIRYMNGMAVILNSLIKKWSRNCIPAIKCDKYRAEEVKGDLAYSIGDTTRCIVNPCLPNDSPESPPLLSPSDLTPGLLFELLPWTRTLRVLKLGSCRDYPVQQANERRFLQEPSPKIWMAQILRGMPLLENLEILQPINDLLIFERDPNSSFSSERPLLTRLVVVQARVALDGNVETWCKALRARFRFLDTLEVTAE